jgi:tetratricopeptide (TPR) repeat protein
MIPRGPPAPPGGAPPAKTAQRQSLKPACVQQKQQAPTPTISRRAALVTTLSLLAAAADAPRARAADATPRSASASAAAMAGYSAGTRKHTVSYDDGDVERLVDEAEAFAAYSERDFPRAEQALTRLLDAQQQQSGADRARLLEMRAAAYVDDKKFPAALADYDAALREAADNSGAASASDAGSNYSAPTARARLLAGRALAREGVSDWQGALNDYTAAERLAVDGGGARPDPYIRNSQGNCLASLGKWQEARQAYLEASEMFQRASGFRGRGGSTTARLDGAIFAASNAALALAQLGDVHAATKEVERVARRAPGSADMRAALAALYWSQGRRSDAEGAWEFACGSISVGCSRYKDRDWLLRIRRWPPAMVERMDQFLSMS